MPPRPRPRPRPQAVLAPSPVSRTQTLTSALARKSAREEEEEEEDDLFIRSKGRSLREVHKRAAKAAAIAKTSSALIGSDEDDEDEEETPKHRLGRARRQNVFNTGKAKALPKWAKKGAIKSLLGDSDSELENNNPSRDNTPSRKRHAGGSGLGTPSGNHGKRTRTRSRSRSLTPPPDLTTAEKMRARIAIQQALDSALNDIPLRSSVIEVEDEGSESDVGETMLDPALQHIAQAVRDRVSKQKTDDVFGSLQYSGQEMSHQHPSSDVVVVTIRVKWVSHPEYQATHGRAQQQSWSFQVKRHDSLKELLLQTSNNAHVLPEDIVLMRDGKQVFTSVSPEGLGFWDQGDLEACNRATFDALRLRRFRSPTPALQYPGDPEPNREVSAPPSETSMEPDETEKFKLVLRARGTKEVTLSVRSTTTCGKIVRAFLAVVAKHGGKAPTSPRKVAQVRLCVDGEKQHPDTLISECDLEDGDMVEVVGM